jgi:AraC-like DNA-binding protein
MPIIDSVRNHERHFYKATDAFGRFGMRLFEPVCMETAHWHGHIELNHVVDGSMDYLFDGELIHVPEGRLAMFWAGIPHQLINVQSSSKSRTRLCNIYLPVDSFLFLPHITELQMNILAGGMALLPEDICNQSMIERWYGDYRSGDFERTELVKMELNALFRRAQLNKLDYLRLPDIESTGDRCLSSSRIRHVVLMVRYILEHLAEPMNNADVAKATGLHQNYALSLFSHVMHMPVKRFIVRLRLMRARVLLVESSMAITSVAVESGFASISQFYHHFKQIYGISPNQLRSGYISSR